MRKPTSWRAFGKRTGGGIGSFRLRDDRHDCEPLDAAGLGSSLLERTDLRQEALAQIAEQAHLINALRGFGETIKEGGDADTLLCSAAFRSVIARLDAAQRQQRELLQQREFHCLPQQREVLQQGRLLLQLLAAILPSKPPETPRWTTENPPPPPPRPAPTDNTSAQCQLPWGCSEGSSIADAMHCEADGPASPPPLIVFGDDEPGGQAAAPRPPPQRQANPPTQRTGVLFEL